MPGGKVRLNHLELDSASAAVSWSAAHGGSVLVTLPFLSTGKEILGTYHGHINNGRLSIYLAVRVDPDGRLYATPFTSFSASINIIGANDVLERSLRKKIAGEIEQKAAAALEGRADELLRLVVATLVNAPPENAFFIQIQIFEDHAIITWANSVKHAEVVIEGADPNIAEPDESLRLQLNGGWSGGQTFGVSRTAAPNKQIVLPLKLSGISLPDNLALVVKITLYSIDQTNPQNPKIKTIGTIHRTFSSPGYGAGEHTDSDGGLTVGYRITLT